MRYPHLKSGSTSDFPRLETVNAYKFDNGFDYSRYDYSQMRITICRVGWDMGEARIGTRIESQVEYGAAIGNVVHFGTKAKRDEWFDSIPDSECYRFDTRFKDLHNDNFIDVPISFDICAKWNYAMVEYSLFANDESPVEYESDSGVKRWFYFIRSVDSLAPNTTRLSVLPDIWQTFIYDLNVTTMRLARGHAPMLEISADKYLKNPLENSSGLLAQDVNFGDRHFATGGSEFIFNSGSMKALVFTTASTSGFGSKSVETWNTPAGSSYTLQGITGAYNAFCLDAGSLSSFLANMESSIPQFAQTIKGMAFVSESLLTLGSSFEFCGISCNRVNAYYKQNQLISLDKSMFGYSKRYANLAKLYTFPYSYLEISDEMGNVTEIRIEDTNGTIKIESSVSLLFPFLNITSHLTGIGSRSRKKVSFSSVSERTMPIQGDWYKTVKAWQIPIFGVIQDNGTTNDYSTHFDRKQQKVAADNAYDAAIAQANANRTIANNNASNETANASVNVAANLAVTAANDAFSSSVASNANTYSVSNFQANQSATAGMRNADLEKEKATAAASATGSVAGGIASLSPSGAINGFISAGVTMAQCQAGCSYLDYQAETNGVLNSNVTTANITKTASDNTATITRNDTATNAENSRVTGIAANNAATISANGNAQYSAETTRAADDLDTGYKAISNQIAQSALYAPNEFGKWSDGDSASTRPQGLFANVVTQHPDAIRQAGDEFLRYGYRYNGSYDFDGNWNRGKYFTYWQMTDFWVRDLKIPDAYVDQLRFFLYGGVTVWSNPDDIGRISIYEN